MDGYRNDRAGDIRTTAAQRYRGNAEEEGKSSGTIWKCVTFNSGDNYFYPFCLTAIIIQPVLVIGSHQLVHQPRQTIIITEQKLVSMSLKSSMMYTFLPLQSACWKEIEDSKWLILRMNCLLFMPQKNYFEILNSNLKKQFRDP